MTYIRKRESRENENFLGVFLGERKKAQDTEYVFIRGIMELPASARPERKADESAGPSSEQETSQEKTGLWQAFQKRYGMSDETRESMNSASEPEDSERLTMSAMKKEDAGNGEKASGKHGASGKTAGRFTKHGVSEETAGRSAKHGVSEETAGRPAKYDVSEETAGRSAKYDASEETAGRSAKHDGLEETAGRSAKSGASEKAAESAAPPTDPWERFRGEMERNFPDSEIQGCCVIGTYPAGRINELSARFPEAGRILYHLQDQEERLYWLDGERYEGISGYFVFYEQNQRMQEVLEETFGENSVEEEGLPDKAIRSFREKVRNKAEEKSHSFLKLASSFFVVGVLIVGVIVVNRVQDLQLSAGIGQSEQEAAAVTDQTGQNTSAVGTAEQEATATANQSEQEAPNAGDAAAELTAAAGEDMPSESTGAAGEDMSAESTGAAGEDASDSTLSEEYLLVSSDEILSGSDAYWDDEADTSGTVSTTDETDAAGAGTTTEATSTLGAGITSAESDSDTGITMDVADAAAISITSDESDESGAEDEIDTSAALNAANTANTAVLTDNAAISDEEVSSNDVTDSDIAADTDSDETAAASAVSRQLQASYVIREGDTLAGICAKYYGSLDRLEELCEANDIEDANLILPGQKIVLP
ncbi:MAG: LysM peptidoglycan-binding domain-containing protein [Clostridiales bacterium]|nr:LysM peptidoglycan-binding domain-containing protein [Clostridiales bacterium]